MRIRFNVHYNTHWGQTMHLVIQDSLKPDMFSGTTDHEMTCNEMSEWLFELAVDDIGLIRYRYAVVNPDGSSSVESETRQIQLPTNTAVVELRDNWRASYGESPFCTTAFTDCFFRRASFNPPLFFSSGNFLLRVYCPNIEPGRHLAIVGNQDVLGNWDVARKLRLDESEFPVWSIQLDASKIQFPVEYKYLIVETSTDEVLAWDGGANRIINAVKTDVFTCVTDEHFVRQTPAWKCAGVAIPVFSLRSNASLGIGEFYDLKMLVDWAKKTGQRIIQTLPVNDTILYHSNCDSYPYNAVSVYALHPVYLHLDSVGKLKSKKQRDYFSTKKEELNAKTFSDYQHVMNVKWEFLKAIYLQDASEVLELKEYKQFFEKNREWLVPYAVFSYLRDLNGTPEFREWKQYSVYCPQEVAKLASPEQSHYHQIALYYFIQYHLHRQLAEVHDYAREQGIAIKGDVPIGVSPRSVDAWMNPELFNTNLQAGAPPDDFSVTGQNWGFPTYNWELMEKDGYRWWKKRFAKMAEYFDAYRIDHILGFFRIWGIPVDAVWGLTGSFQPSLPFTVEELTLKGLVWDEERFLKPYLREHVLYATFGKYTDDAIREYFQPDGWQCYAFKQEFDTQKKIEKHFASLGCNFGTKEIMIRDGLYMLHCEVLFVRDVHFPDKFHPRVSMHNSATFRDLSEDTRCVLDVIYIDYFYHRHTDFWKQQAMKKLPALISATKMLVCGEDLGMVPDSVPDVMNALEILSLEIQRMPKKSNTEFAMPADAPYLSVCSTSTHDMNPLRAWWEEEPELTQRFYNRALGMQGQAPATCESWIAERIITQHLASDAMLTIFPWQDWVAVESDLCLEDLFAERINVPSNPRNFWCYRMHIPLEQLLKEDTFNNKIKTLIAKSGR